MPYPSYNRKHSQDSTNSSIASDTTSHSFKYTETNHVAVADHVEPPVVNNFHNDRPDSYQCSNVEDEKLSDTVSNPGTDEMQDKAENGEEEEEILNSCEDTSINLDVVPGVSVEDVVIATEESQSKPDLLGSEFSNEEISIEESSTILKLPDLTEISQEKLKEREYDKIGSFDLIRNDNDTGGGFAHSEVPETHSG